MFRYKNAKYKSNYIHINITAGADEIPINEETDESVCLQQGECTLTFSLLPGNYTASARYEAGTMGEDTLIGETTVFYKYERGKIYVCDYDYVSKGYYEKQHYDTPPVFRLYRKRKNQEMQAAEQPLLEVSSTQEPGTQKEAAFYNKNERWKKQAAENIRKQLRTLYVQMLDSLRDAGILLRVHLDDDIHRDENGNIVGGTIYNAYQGYQNYFYNIEGSRDDKYPSGYSGWLDCYDKYITSKFNPVSHNVAGHQYCASTNNNLACGRPIFYGGHVFCPNAQWNETNAVTSGGVQYRATTLTRQQHMVQSSSSIYQMLPICSKHNSTWVYDVVMYAGHVEDVLELTNFVFPK